jgi:type IV secretory pathway TraG/TraD family ATPase VirD4
MSPQDFMGMDKGELVCFSLEYKPIRLKSMNAKRHPQLKESIGMKPPERPLPPVAESQQNPPSAPKPPPLQSWHFDPQLFRKWPQVHADNGGAGEHVADREEAREASLGL